MAYTLTGELLKTGFLSLKKLCQTYLDIELSKEEQVSDWSKKLSDSQIAYAATDALVTFHLFYTLASKIKAANKSNAYQTKRDAQFAIASMKVAGLHINKEKHKTLMDNWTKKKEESKARLKESLGDVNPNSPDQLNIWLKSNLDKKTIGKWQKTKTGKLKTSQDILEMYRDKLPWLDEHENFKKANKLMSTYGEGLVKHINPVSGRIHSDIMLANTDTGRLSSSKPNCQNFPRESYFREIFEAVKGKKLVLADYSQIELRVAAIVANDETMLEAYKKGEDLHRKTAAFVANIDEKKVTKSERQKAKAINFGFMYGQQVKGFVKYAQDQYGVDMTLQDAEKARSKYFSNYKGIAKWQETTKKQVAQTRQARTPMGFVRYFARSMFTPSMENAALNLPIQGGAAEITLKALMHIAEKLDWKKAKIINCIHDEIILESDENYVADSKTILEESMIQGFLDVFPKGSIKGLVEVKVGSTWAEAK